MKKLRRLTSSIACLASVAVMAVAESAHAQCQRGQSGMGVSSSGIAGGPFMGPMGSPMRMNNPYASFPQQMNNVAPSSNNSVSMTPAQHRQALQAQYQAKMDRIREKKAAAKAANAPRRKPKSSVSTQKSPVAIHVLGRPRPMGLG